VAFEYLSLNVLAFSFKHLLKFTLNDFELK